MPEFRFADPAWLILLLGLPLIAWWRSREATRPAVLFSTLAPLRRLPRTWAQRVKTGLPWMEILGIALLVCAMGRPQAGRIDERIETSGIAMQLVFDRSGSMRELDLDEDRFDRDQMTRLSVVKGVMKDFLDEGGELPGRPHDLVGLVSFCGYPQAHTPLTLDHQAIIRVLETIEMPVPADGRSRRDMRILNRTAMGDGMMLALDRLHEVEAESRVMVLLSDGASNTGVAKPREAAQHARDMGVKIYAIGIGTRRGGLDAGTLDEVAERTGGRYWNVRSADGLREVYERIDELERSEIESFQATRWRELYPWIVLAGIGLLALHRILILTRFRSLP